MPPGQFFAPAFGVDDYYTGNGADKLMLVAKAEITILMFYAPWSLESREARRPFSAVVNAFQNSSIVVSFEELCWRIICKRTEIRCGELPRSSRTLSAQVWFARVSGNFCVCDEWFAGDLQSTLHSGLFVWVRREAIRSNWNSIYGFQMGAEFDESDTKNWKRANIRGTFAKIRIFDYCLFAVGRKFFRD